MVNNPPANAGTVEDRGSILGLGRSPGEGNGNLLHYSCLGNTRQRSLVGYSPWSCQESDTGNVPMYTEQLSMYAINFCDPDLEGNR